MQLEEWRTRFEGLGVRVAAMTYDSLDKLKVFHDSKGLGYPLLGDVDARHVSAFGVEDPNMGEGIPRPGILWLSPEGRINAKFAVPGYRTRPPFGEVLEAVRVATNP